MITVLIGHRGAGKTALLKKIAIVSSVDAIDLDETLEKIHGQSIQQLVEQGLDRFREMEILAFRDIVATAKSPTVIAVGAGFQGEMPEGARVVWIRRATDSDGRIFLDRPRLTELSSPLGEFKSLFAAREDRYRKMATDILQMPEGYDSGLEEFFNPLARGHLGTDLTLFPYQLTSEFIQRRLAWGVRRFELRTDLLSPQELAWGFASIPASHVLYSIRTPDFPEPPMSVMTDWPLERGEPSFKSEVISIHKRDDNLSTTLSRLQRHDGILKLAVEINSFSELLEGHRWWEEDSRHRAFLPSSQNGRWQWYRSLMGPEMPLHFIREDQGSALDQPYLWQSLMQPPFKGKFAAVLGSPVHHSRTPMVQLEFFRQRGIPIVAIDLTEAEFDEGMSVLGKLGLHFSAVTSPLKKLASELCQEIEGVKLGSVNTLARSKSRWYGTNTDVEGLAALRSNFYTGRKIGLWGGGGVRSSVETVFPEATTYSARKGAEGMASPEVLLWAVGRNREFQWPPRDWKLEQILDLNYTANSPGLELAKERGIPYVSGLEMFESQAEGQRRFWHRYL